MVPRLSLNETSSRATMVTGGRRRWLRAPRSKLRHNLVHFTFAPTTPVIATRTVIPEMIDELDVRIEVDADVDLPRYSKKMDPR